MSDQGSIFVAKDVNIILLADNNITQYNPQQRGHGETWERQGFTSIELIIVMIVLSILGAAVIIKNPFGLKDYSGIARDQLIADIRLIQMKAIGSKTSQTITFFVAADGGFYNLGTLRKHLPGNAQVTSSFANSITFNNRGEPSGSGDIKLTGDAKVTIIPETGRAE